MISDFSPAVIRKNSTRSRSVHSIYHAGKAL